jgi:fibrillarin-like rRNA methylase
MSRPGRFRPARRSPRLAEVAVGGRSEFWTETASEPPPVYGERWANVGPRAYRAFDPTRSKLAAGLLRGWEGDVPSASEKWLYLGAASGTTASHVADLVGPAGAVYAVERSVRPFARLLALAERWNSLLPILHDARSPAGYSALVPPVDGVYADIAQPDQVAIVLANARLLLRGSGGRVLVALKTASMGRERSPVEHLHVAEAELGAGIEPERPVKLDPFHRGHFLLGGRATARLFDGGVRPRARPPPARSPERRRS